MTSIVISGTGLYTPEQSISNDELVASFNSYVAQFNEDNAESIERGELEALHPSSSEFIEKASGIRSRYVVNKSGILDIDRMCPEIPERDNAEHSLQCEIALAAAKEALAMSGRNAADIDAVIVACANLQRAYPAMAIEVQAALGIEGFGFDMNVACSSSTFGIQTAVDSIMNGNARAVLVINPEICSGHLNFRDRDAHFIFGDVCTAIVLERKDTATDGFEILGTRLRTSYSNNIRNNFGFLNRADESGIGAVDKLFVQNGRKVFKEVVPMVAAQISSHLDDLSIDTASLKRMWLHQANIGMNQLIAKKVLGHPASDEESPTILDEYANTSSAGSVIAFHKHSSDFQSGDIGVICSFGAGYSIGSVVVRKC